MEESQGSLEGGSEAKTMEEQCLLAYLLWLELSQLSKQLRPPPREVTPITVVLALVI